jgi:PGF-CTERM protein
VLFNESASNASQGYYVIDDIANTYWTDTDAGSSVDWEIEDVATGDLTEDGVFAFDDPAGADDPYRPIDAYRLNIETADRSTASWQNESTGYIDVAEPKVETEILAASDADDDDIEHTPGEDAFTAVNDVDNVTAEIDRWYRVNATLTDYFGTPINGSEFSETTVRDAFGWEGVPTDEDAAGFDSDNANVVFHDTLGNNADNGITGESHQAELELNNENGTFQFDVEPTSADDAGQFDMEYDTTIIDAPADGWADENIDGAPDTGAPNAVFEDSPIGTRPLVEVYDQSGAKLPVDEETGNKILANDVTQTIRIEAFPSDENDLSLPRRTFRINTSADPVNENTINTRTELQNRSVLVTDNEDYLNIPYSDGQVGYLTVTPTGTGEEVITLRDDDMNAVQNIEGDTIVFDVLRSNKQANLEIDTESVTPGGSVTVTVTAASTGEPISLAGVTLSDTNGNAISDVTTNASGMATINVPPSAQLGEYSLETRPAGYQPIVQSFEVSSPAQLDEDLELLAQEGQVISGTTSAEAGTTYTIEIEGPGLLESADAEVQDDGTFSAEFNLSSLSAGDEVTASIAGVDSVTYTVQSPPTSTITMNPQVSQNGDVVTVDEVFLPEGGYVVIHNASTGDVIGHTAYFDAGTYEDVDVLLDENLAGGQNQVIAMSHMDTNGNQVYDFPDADGPYTADGEPVTDSAQVSVSSPPPEPTTTTPEPTTTTPEPTTTTTSTTTDDDDDGDTGDGDGPGFGIAVALVALLGAALLAVRRNA